MAFEKTYVLSASNNLWKDVVPGAGSRVFAGDGNDSIYGRDGNDELNGEAGDDFLYGESGNDTIVGGEHDDTMIGGHGADKFVFSVTIGAEGGSWLDSFEVSSTDEILDPEYIDILYFEVNDPMITTVADLDAYVMVVDNGTDVMIYFDRDGGDRSWTGDAEDLIILRDMGIAPGAEGISSLVELMSSINIQIA